MMNEGWNRNLERLAFGTLVALLLSPVVAQGLWRPLVHVLGPAGTAGHVTGSALVIGGAMALVTAWNPARTPLLALGVGALVAIGASFGFSLGLPGLLTLMIVTIAMGFLMRRLFTQLPTSLDGLAKRHKLLTALYVLLAVASVVSSARLSIFIGDSSRVEQQVLPGEKFLETHSCLTAYVQAATLSRQRVDNLYAHKWWHGSHGFPPAEPGVENPYRPFVLDYFAYPPPFLLIMAPLAPWEGDFLAQRALWFGLSSLLLVVGLWVVARWIDGPGAHRVLLLAPIFFGSMPVLATLQIGNFQIAVVVISVLAMVAFDRNRHVMGGALLALTILSKLSPGLLGIVLLVQRRFRSAVWTAGFGLLFLALSVLMIGVNPIQSFLTYTLPRISSGEAFSFLDDTPFNILTNMGPFGLPFKLQLMGFDVGDPWVLARRIGRVYTVVLVVVAIVAARRTGDRRTQAITWMSVLVLAALQSPFAPLYTTIGLLWAITLLSAEVRRFRDGLALVFLWLVLTVIPPIRLSLLVGYTLLQSAFTIGIPIWLIVRTGRSSSKPSAVEP